MKSYVLIKLDGSVIPSFHSESGIAGMSLQNHTKIYSLYSDSNIGANKGGTAQLGSVQTGPFALLKVMDGTSPMLRQAMFLNHTVEATIKMFLRNPGSGAYVLHHEIELKNARIVGIRQEVQQQVSAEIEPPPMERILINALTINERSLQSNFSYESSASQSA